MKTAIIICCLIISVKCGLLNNVLGSVTGELRKVKDDNLVNTINRETKEVVEDISGLLDLGKTDKSEDDVKITEKPKNVINQPNTPQKGPDPTKASLEETDKINNGKTTIHENLSTKIYKSTGASNTYATSSTADEGRTNSDEINSSTDVNTPVLGPRAAFTGDCLPGFGYADDGTCQEII